MCQSKEQGGRRCQGALRRQRCKSARETAERTYEETGKATLGLITSHKDLQEAIDNQYVYKRESNDFPELSIYCYTRTAQYRWKWNEVTTEARGLILNEDGEIIARPFGKFFNEGNIPEGHDFPRTGPMEVMEKFDGSLGILYPRPDGTMAVATKGAMDSDRAHHATKVYNERYAGTWSPDPDYTYCYEIIYPENRIVIDYGDTDDIILLGARHKATGRSMTRAELEASGWQGPMARIYDFKDFGEVMQAREEGIEGKEGFVVHYPDHSGRVKIKFDDYLNIHRQVTNITSADVFDSYSQGQSYAVAYDLPDEFYGEVEKVEQLFANRDKAQQEYLHSFYEKTQAQMKPGASQKEFADFVLKTSRETEHPYGLNSKAVTASLFGIKKGAGIPQDMIRKINAPKGGISLKGLAELLSQYED